ncbi:hypothetical protein ALC57_13490 [Trachymyrmex cornetzi]|uniref:Uncharacterized protein n=1 Tax=Trachymyrmex cornetzi TaxID=471704 RepID=A0A195DN72_9HYME|nr:hypothetical protein ALC57_13490 [Trachymyrmex cornetzi]
MAKKRYARVGAASFPAGDLELVNLNHETVEDEETRNCFLRNFDKTFCNAVQNGEGAHTLLAPAAQDEISFPPAPILCPVIVHVKQPETCICPVGSQRRFPIVLSSALRPPHHGAILSGATRHNHPDGEDHQPSRGKIPPRSTPQSSEIDLSRVTTARSAMFLACIVYTALTETSNEKELAATRRSHFEVLPRESTTDPKVVGGIHPLPTSKHPPRRPLPFPSGFPPPNEKKRTATRLYEEVEEGGESARGQRREMRLKENVGGGELRRRSSKPSSHRLPRSGPEWRKGVGKAGGGRMAELDEGGFSDVDSPSTTNPPASSPTLDRARGMKDE